MRCLSQSAPDLELNIRNTNLNLVYVLRSRLECAGCILGRNFGDTINTDVD